MTMLHFLELGIRGHKAVHALTGVALREYEAHLQRTKAHQESTALRLAWRSPGAENVDDDGVWVELVGPTDDPDAADTIFDAFLDEDQESVQEVGDEPTGLQRRGRYRRDRAIRIAARNSERRWLKLERLPAAPLLELTPNTWSVECQIRAVQRLKSMPVAEQIPLLRLFEAIDHAEWPWFSADTDDVVPTEWFELRDESRPGTTEQRKFVRIALATPDFALLEGPPGSGKTTAITELILQLVARGHRVLLCASTHVAVDNVLERLAEQVDADDSDVLPVRLGDHDKVSKKARRFQIEELRREERRRLVRFLSTRPSPSESQRRLLSSLREGDAAIDRLVIDCANLVCGTMIGILRHPELKPRPGYVPEPQFDVLILDEASKTTFQEFLVPALLARRWVIVGDPKQLSPFVDQEELQASLSAALPDGAMRAACADGFAAGAHARERASTRVVVDDAAARRVYIDEGAARGLRVVDAGDAGAADADIVLGSAEDLATIGPPADGRQVRVRGSKEDVRRIASRLGGAVDDPYAVKSATAWEEELAWRLITRFQLRYSSLAQEAGAGESEEARDGRLDALNQAIAALLPTSGHPAHRAEADAMIERTCSIALPSIIEVLQRGNDRRPGRGDRTAISDGLPDSARERRHVLLEHQHRMHPDISRVPRVHVYGGDALKDAPDMAERRGDFYGEFAHRGVWIQTAWTQGGGLHESEREATAIDDEIRSFVAWARNHPRKDREPWEIAVLAFYRPQERMLREMVRLRTVGQQAEHRHFHVGDASHPDVTIEVCTVDRFQGHEADVVFISFANDRATSFLESQNRLNVALTRARYLRVLVGDRIRLGRSTRSPLLRTLAQDEPWGRSTEAGR